MRSRQRNRSSVARTLLSAKVGNRKRPAFESAFLLTCHPERSEGSAVRREWLHFQLHQLRLHFSRINPQPPHAHWQAETARPSAAWIEIEDAAFLFHLRLMAVAINHHAKSGGFRLQVELAAIMQHIDGHAADSDDFSFRQNARPRSSVDVAADRGYRGNP